MLQAGISSTAWLSKGANKSQATQTQNAQISPSAVLVCNIGFTKQIFNKHFK